MGISTSSLRKRAKVFTKESTAAAQSTSKRSLDRTRSGDRYAASALLTEANIANVIWLEDVLVFFGSDTQVWDLNLLVQDPPAAAATLQHAGYMPSAPSESLMDDANFREKSLRLRQPHSKTSVVLYSATDWFFELEADRRTTMPLLNEFMDSMMEIWLNISFQDYVDRIRFALHVATLLRYCYNLDDPNHGPVNSPDYALNLREEHRELHYDIVSEDPQKLFAHTARHRYHVRRYTEIKSGEFTPRPHKKGAFQPELAAHLEEG